MKQVKTGSKYLDLYVSIWPDDSSVADRSDPRRGEIIDEMRAVCRAKTFEDACKVIDWWVDGRNEDHVREFRRDLRRLLRLAVKRGLRKE